MSDYIIFLIVHAGMGFFALTIGSFNLFIKNIALERIFVLFSTVSIFASVFIIRYIEEGIAVQLAFVCLIILWSYFCFKTLHHKGNRKKINPWFLRAYAVVLFFITMRVWRGLFLLLGFSFVEAYSIGSWLGITGNIMAVGYFILKKKL